MQEEKTEPTPQEVMIGLRAEALGYALAGGSHLAPEEVTRRASMYADFMANGTVPADAKAKPVMSISERIRSAHLTAMDKTNVHVPDCPEQGEA